MHDAEAGDRAVHLDSDRGMRQAALDGIEDVRHGAKKPLDMLRIEVDRRQDAKFTPLKPAEAKEAWASGG